MALHLSVYVFIAALVVALVDRLTVRRARAKACGEPHPRLLLRESPHLVEGEVVMHYVRHAACADDVRFGVIVECERPEDACGHDDDRLFFRQRGAALLDAAHGAPGTRAARGGWCAASSTAPRPSSSSSTRVRPCWGGTARSSTAARPMPCSRCR